MPGKTHTQWISTGQIAQEQDGLGFSGKLAILLQPVAPCWDSWIAQFSIGHFSLPWRESPLLGPWHGVLLSCLHWLHHLCYQSSISSGFVQSFLFPPPPLKTVFWCFGWLYLSHRRGFFNFENLFQKLGQNIKGTLWYKMYTLYIGGVLYSTHLHF